MKHTIDDIIDIAGGRKTVAYQMNLHSFSVQRWARTGIPAKYWDKLISLARERNVIITPNDLFEANKAVDAAETESAE